jgi:hypothetical protein
MEWAQAAAIIGVLTAVIGLQSFWIAHALSRIEVRLDRLEGIVLREHAERIARLEARFD